MDKEVTTTEDQDVIPPIADNTLVAIADQAEKRVEAMHKIKRMALRLTNPHDWVNENDRPYLQGSGSEKVARLFGISWRIYEPEREDLGDGHYIYTYRGEFSLAGASIEAIGARSSRDGFFKRYDKNRNELPPSEIDSADVKKSAYTNLLGNGITRLLGIRNLAWDDLKEFAGITKDQLRLVQYGKRAAAPSPTGTGAPGGQSTGKPTAQLQDPGAPATEDQVKAIHAILKDRLTITDELAKAQKVQEILGLKTAPTSLSKLTKAEASTVIDRLNKEANEAK